MKVALVVLVLCACEHAEPPHKQPPPPTPTKPDPIRQARDEFELLPADYAVGTHLLYTRGDFTADPESEAAFDEGDFIGRLRTLFGAREGDEYVFRHKKTGYVITAYSGKSGPAYGGGARYPGVLPPADPKALLAASFQHPDDGGADARRKADPVLAKGNPMDHASREHPLDLRDMHVYDKHLADADAGPELAAAVARLDALIAAVPPADWETTFYYDDEPSVLHVGARGGRSFNDTLPAAQGFEFLAHAAETQDPKARDELGGIPYEADADLIDFYLAHQDDLADQRPRVVAAFRRFIAEAKSHSGDMRQPLLDEAHELATRLHVAAP